MTNLSPATEAIMTEAPDDVAAEVDTVAVEADTTTDEADEADEDDSDVVDLTTPTPAPPTVEPTFKMDPDATPFKRLWALYDSGDTETFNAILSAMELVFGEVPSVIEKGFHSTLKVQKAKGEIQKYDVELSGYTPGQSLIKLLEQGDSIATGAGGSVSWNISLVTEGEGDDAKQKVVFKSSFRGIDGVSSGSGSGGSRGSYDYFDKGTLISTSLKRYIVDKHPASHAAGLLRKNDEARAAGKKSGLSSFEAAKTGMENGDSFVITRSAKKKAASK